MKKRMPNFDNYIWDNVQKFLIDRSFLVRPWVFFSVASVDNSTPAKWITHYSGSSFNLKDILLLSFPPYMINQSLFSYIHSQGYDHNTSTSKQQPTLWRKLPIMHLSWHTWIESRKVWLARLKRNIFVCIPPSNIDISLPWNQNDLNCWKNHKENSWTGHVVLEVRVALFPKIHFCFQTSKA